MSKRRKKQKVRPDRSFFGRFNELSGRDQRIAKRRFRKMERRQDKERTRRTNELLSLGIINERSADVQRETRRAERATRRRGSPTGTKRSQTLWTRDLNLQRAKTRRKVSNQGRVYRTKSRR